MDYKEAYYILIRALNDSVEVTDNDIYEALTEIFIALSRLEIIEKGVK